MTDQRTQQLRTRAPRAALMIAACLMLGVVTHVVRKSVPGADFAGGVLYVMCWAVLFWLVARPLGSAVLAVAVSCLAEFSQLIAGVSEAAMQSIWLRLALGTTFDPMDFVSYAVGGVSSWLILRRLAG